MSDQNDINIRVRSTDDTANGLNNARRRGEEFRNTLREIGRTAAGVLTADIAMRAAEGFKNMVTDSVRAASDLNESLNAVNVTFGASAKEILDWGKTNAASFGLSQRAFNEMATPLGAMLKNAGLSMQDVSKWTIDLTKRASDMASVFNTSVPDALEAIQAGLRGESDPLERYGVGLSAAKVEAEALAETGKRAASSLTAQELATARLNIIMKQTSQTAGDFQNTSDGLANATRIAQAQMENAKASLGNALLPILAKAATAAATLAEGFNKLPGPMQATVVVVGALGTAAVLLLPRIQAARTAITEMGISSQLANTRLGTFAKGAGAAMASIAALQMAGAALGDHISVGTTTASNAMEEYAKSGKMAQGVTKDLDYAMLTLDDNEWYNKAGKGVAVFTEQISGLGGVFDNSVQHANESISAMDQGLAALVQGGKADTAAQAFERLRQEADGVPIERLKQAFPQYAEALAVAAKQSDKTADSAKNLTQSVTEQRKAIEDAANAILGQRDAMRGLEASYDDASDAVKKNGKTLDIGTEKGRANQEALDGIASAASKASQAILDQGGSQAEANKVMATARTRFINTATAMGMGATEAKRLADKLFAIPKNTTANVSVNTAAADASIARLRSKLFALQGLAMDIHAGEQGHGAGVYAPGMYKATGGIVGRAATGGVRSNRVLVGEHGPEVVDLAPGSRVHSNPDSEGMAASGGTATLVLEINSSGSRTDDLLLEILRRAIRVRGGDVQVVLGRG